MGAYRESRNIEQATVDKIRSILTDNSYTEVTVVKGFKKAYDIDLDPQDKNAIISVRAGSAEHESVEIGTKTTRRKPLILIDLFCTSEGQRLDLKDLLIANLKGGWDYVEVVIAGGVTQDAYVDSKTTNGRIEVDSISDTPINFDIDRHSLDIHDRFRWLISLNCSKTLLES